MALALAIALAAAWVLLRPSGDGTPKAVIVDQLQLTSPNPEFVTDATALLEGNGYQVDYYPGEDVTVDLYRTLPKRGYDLVILRVHSTAEISRGEEAVKSISLFTNEAYNKIQYYEEQAAGRVGFASYKEGGPQYFGITSGFITDSMEGNFDGAVVLMMGCQGLVNEKAAEASTDKGARNFIGWDGLVSADHTDEATQMLLRELVVNKATPEDAIARTMTDVGPDPDFGSQLLAWP